MKLTAFRTATPADIDLLLNLVNTAYHPAPNSRSWTDEARYVGGTRTEAASLADLLSQTASVVLLGLHEETVLACVHLEQADDGVHIGMLAVNTAWQGLGIGKQMLAQAESYAREQFNATRLVMIVIELRHELIAFYERRGYLKTGETIDYATLCGPSCTAKIAQLQFVVLAKALPDPD